MTLLDTITAGVLMFSTQLQYVPFIEQAVVKYKIDPVLIIAVIAEESHFNARAKGKHGECGLMQIGPEMRQEEKLSLKHCYTPSINIMRGTKRLAKAVRQADGDLEKAVRLYNGNGKVTIAGCVYEAKCHAWRVMRTYWQIKYEVEKKGEEL